VFVPKCARQDITFGDARFRLSAKAVSVAAKILFKPLVPCVNKDCLVEFEAALVEGGEEIKMANM